MNTKPKLKSAQKRHAREHAWRLIAYAIVVIALFTEHNTGAQIAAGGAQNESAQAHLEPVYAQKHSNQATYAYAHESLS